MLTYCAHFGVSYSSSGPSGAEIQKPNVTAWGRLWASVVGKQKLVLDQDETRNNIICGQK